MAGGSGLFVHNKQNAWFPATSLLQVKLSKAIQCYTHSTMNHEGPYVLYII